MSDSIVRNIVIYFLYINNIIGILQNWVVNYFPPSLLYNLSTLFTW